MELILSNILPVRHTTIRNMYSVFNDLLLEADGLRIASGYISADALTELKKLIEMNEKSYLELVIGMHGFDGFTRSQYEAAEYLDSYLRFKNAGGVRIATVFKFHGKVCSFLKNTIPFAAIIGSSNLNSIFDNLNIYEVDLLLREKETVLEVDTFLSDLSEKACVFFKDWKLKGFIEGKNTLMEGLEGVEKMQREEFDEIWPHKIDVSFKIPIKSDDALRSNLNVFFGKGRVDQRGFIKPRHWYEVEVIVPNSITRDSSYPQAGRIITVITDDGWKFRCKISGDYSKNFRSHDDLKTLGRWFKGRLENSGAMKVGEMVTKETLRRYGRDNFELIASDDPDVWLLDFSV
ncbi:MAG: NgoFVII family restriction endonuclease [Nitrospirae bacterium]|nr:NgoFVII family restriction endonuclease [Nitrospirota bacterium]